MYVNQLRQLRFERRLRQIELASKTRIHPSILSRIENGWLRPSPDQRKKLARALKVEPDWLFPEDDNSRM